MGKKALIVIEVHDKRVFPSILLLAERADLVILDRNGAGNRLPTPLKQVGDCITTRGINPDKPNYSAFDGGTLRPIESLESILAREQVSDVVVCGATLRTIVSQTAFDANALGYNTLVCYDATIPGGEILGPLKKLQAAGIDFEESSDIWI